METKITKHFFMANTMKYFRGNAHRVELGTYGKKHDPIGAKAYLEPQSKVKSEHLASRMQIGTLVTVDWNEVSKADLEAEADLKFFSLGKKVAVDFNLEKAKSAKLKLISLAINTGPLTAMLNKDADSARKFLAEEGNDGRIVSEAWVVVDAELGEHFDAHGSTSLSVEAFGSSLDLTVTGGKYGSQTITYSPGTTFAYMLHKVKDWNKDKTRIESMADDYKGLG
jgi:hypothetical protein